MGPADQGGEGSRRACRRRQTGIARTLHSCKSNLQHKPTSDGCQTRNRLTQKKEGEAIAFCCKKEQEPSTGSKSLPVLLPALLLTWLPSEPPSHKRAWRSRWA